MAVSSERASSPCARCPPTTSRGLPDPGDGAMQLSPATASPQTIERVAKAASRDETRPVLTGILVSVDGRALRMVATDSYRLSVKETPLETARPSAFEANVPARALQELGRVVRGDRRGDGLDRRAGQPGRVRGRPRDCCRRG